MTELEELARRRAGATPGPWVFNPGNGIHTPRGECIALTHNGEYRSLDAALIVGLVNAAPQLFADHRAVERVRALCDDALKRMGGDLRSDGAIAALHAMPTVSANEIWAAIGGAE